MNEYLESLGSQLGALAGDIVRSGGVRVYVKTNLGPEVAVTGTGNAQRGLLDLLGLKAAVVVRDRDGRRIAGYGDPPATDPFRVALLVTVAGALGFVLLRGVLKR